MREKSQQRGNHGMNSNSIDKGEKSGGTLIMRHFYLDIGYLLSVLRQQVARFQSAVSENAS